MTLLLVPLYTLAAIGLACVVQRVLDAIRRANRVIDEAPVRLDERRARQNNVRLVPPNRGA